MYIIGKSGQKFILCHTCNKYLPLSDFRIGKKKREREYRVNKCFDCEFDRYHANSYRDVDVDNVKKAKRAVRDAIEKGELIRPSVCEMCGGYNYCWAYHWCFNERFWRDVIWVCHGCHEDLHGHRLPLLRWMRDAMATVKPWRVKSKSIYGKPKTLVKGPNIY
jgi:hypothetical protein